MVFSLFRLPPPCTDKHRTPMPHCPTNHPDISYEIPQVNPTSYSSPQIAHNPFCWICSPTLASKKTSALRTTLTTQITIKAERHPRTDHWRSFLRCYGLGGNLLRLCCCIPCLILVSFFLAWVGNRNSYRLGQWGRRGCAVHRLYSSADI